MSETAINELSKARDLLLAKSEQVAQLQADLKTAKINEDTLATLLKTSQDDLNRLRTDTVANWEMIEALRADLEAAQKENVALKKTIVQCHALMDEIAFGSSPASRAKTLLP